jgi:hypothetical protein
MDMLLEGEVRKGNGVGDMILPSLCDHALTFFKKIKTFKDAISLFQGITLNKR